MRFNHSQNWRSALTTLLLALASNAPIADTLHGRVIGILDGDTISLIDVNHGLTRIRLDQIDAPEKRQAFGTASKQSLSSLVYGKEIQVEVVDTDKYGRTVGKVRLGKIDINLEQVRLGMAWVYEKYARDPNYFEAQTKAREHRVGLWVDRDPTPPWVYRHPEQAAPSAPRFNAHESAVACSASITCKAFTRCREAIDYFDRCHTSTLDANRDGRPCESLCRVSAKP